MRAGSLNKYLNFLKKAELPNVIGELVESFEDVFNQKVPVSIRDVQTTEKYFDNSVLAKTELIISMRYNSMINEDLVVEFENRKYEIIKINNIYAQNKQLLLAVKGFDFE
jgi:head-tail adaptor